MKYLTILVDPPWQQPLSGKRKRSRGGSPKPSLPYPTMSLQQICALPISDLAADSCHLWLWTTNAFLRTGFDVMEAWGFKYLAPIHWLKPSGLGNYVIHRTQTLLLGYRKKCRFDSLRYFPNVLETGNPKRHSQKPEAFHSLIEKVSQEPRIELFAREKRLGWHAWGNEVESDIEFNRMSVKA